MARLRLSILQTRLSIWLGKVVNMAKLRLSILQTRLSV